MAEKPARGADGLRVAYTIEQCWHRVPGGTATSALSAARAIADRNDVELVGVAASHREQPDAPFDPAASGVPVSHLRLPRRVLYESWHRLGRPAVESATGPVDVVHGTGGATPPRSAPLVVTVHDLAVLHYPDHFTRNGQLFLRAAIDAARERSDLVLVPSQATLDDCVAHGFAADRLRLVPWGVDAERATAAQVEAVRRRHGLPERFVLTVGTAEPRKNRDRLLEAVGHLDEPVPLVIVGPDGWGDRAQPPAGVDARNLGFLPTDELRAVYAAATVFCFPSLLEGFGMPVLEALAQATPVVTSSGTSTAELLGSDPSMGSAVDPRDTLAVAAALAAHLETPLDEAVAESWVARFSWANTAALTVAGYREVASK